MKRNTKISAAVIIIIILIAGSFLCIAGQHRIQNQLVTQAKTTNLNNLAGLALSGATKLIEQTSQSCDRTHWYGGHICTATTTQVYAVSTDVAAVTSELSQALQIHGWATAWDLPQPNGYFSSQPTHLYHVFMAANVFRANNDGGAQPVLRSNVTLQITDKPPVDNGNNLPLHITSNLTQKMQAAVNNNRNILLISTNTSYSL